MGIGRREFLKHFAAAFVATTRAIAVQDDLYVNRRLGLAFRKPRGWHFGDVIDMGEMARGQVFDVDPRLNEELRSQLTDDDLPIVTITKEPLERGGTDFTPGITVFLDDFFDALDGPFCEQSDNDIHYCSKLLPEFRLLMPPREFEISGCLAADYLAKFLFQHEQMSKSIPVNMRTINIYQQPTMYNIRLYDSPYLGGRFVHDFTDFISSIRLC